MSSPLFSKSYTHYALGVLTTVFVFNFVDRQILSILAPAIKAELGLSDTQIGALSGIAFGIFYATLGIPVARLADKYSRVNIISICLAIWSLMTALSGLATNFFQLLIARIGVGIGEAGGSPPSHSLLADYFPPDKRATALGIYSLGVPIGVLFGSMAGGWITELFGWRYAFFVVGIPGVVLAIALKLTVREPPRGYSEDKPEEPEQVPFAVVLKTMWGIKTFKFLALGCASHAFVAYGMIAWIPSFLVRAHQLSIGEVGTVLGIVLGLCGALGTVLSGMIGDKLGAKNVRYYMLVPAFAFLLSIPSGAAVYLLESTYLALAIFVIPAFLLQLYTGPTFGITQSLAPLAMRAAASALLLFLVNIVGLVLGPTTIGILSDLLQSNWQMSPIESLRTALVLCNFIYLVSFYFYYKASRTIESDLAASEGA